MTRLDDGALSLHLEVAILMASPAVLTDLVDRDRYRRQAAVSTLARHLAERMRCFDIAMAEDAAALPQLPFVGGEKAA